MLPGCLDCEHSLAGSTFGRRVESHQYVQQFERAIAGVEFATHPVLCVYNEGNFFNTDELPATARRQILRRIDRIPDVKAVIVESLPRYLTKGVLAEMRKILGPRVIEIGIGLESADAVIRTLCVNKSYTLNDFVAAVARVRPYAQALAYVLLKPAFLTEKEALEDAVSTCRYAFDNGIDIVSLEPVNISDYNMSGRLNRIGSYRSCWLWTIVEVVRRASEMGTVRLGGEQFAPKYEHHPWNCPRCTSAFYKAFQRYNATMDVGVLTALRCECRSQWEATLAMKHGSLVERIGSALDELGHQGGFLGA